MNIAVIKTMPTKNVKKIRIGLKVFLSPTYTANGHNLNYLNPHPDPPPLGEGA
jgi:hypothetical protein